MKFKKSSISHVLIALASGVPVAQLPAVELNMESRWQIRDFYNTVYSFGTDATMDWSGNYAGGNSGTVSEPWLEATRVRINFYRAMGGLEDNVIFDPILNAACQDAALMMSVNNALSHFPPTNWLWWTQAGYDAANNGNIAIGSVGADAIDGYMADTGANNAEVGHRRWILLPQADVMGSGDVPGNFTVNPPKNTANTLWVIPDSIGARPTTRDDFVAWPPKGHVPAPLVWSRWSFSYPNANFNSATVSMQSGGQSIPLAINFRGSGSGYPESTIVWVPNGMDTNTRATWPTPNEDETVTVTLNNVVINGQSQSFNYEVTIFDPDAAGSFEHSTDLSHPAKVIKTAPAHFPVTVRDWSEGVQGRTFSTAAYTTVHGAEGGQNPFNMAISDGYSPIQNSRRSSGSSAFHLATPDGSVQILTLPDEFVINSGSPSLSFQSSLAWASESQFASVDINTGSGTNWTSVWTKRGYVESNSSFEPVTVDLSSYVGRTIRLRFRYDRDGSYFFQTDPAVGWAFDDVTLSGVSKVTNIVELPQNLGSDKVTAVFPNAGTWHMQARDIAFDGRTLDWGPAIEVTAETMTAVDVPFAEWKDDPVLGWIYGASGSWKWSISMGYIYVDAFPWLYTTNGWAYYSTGSVYNGIWFYHAVHGFSYTQHDLGGWFIHEPFVYDDPGSWHNFNTPPGG
ncbi:MAG: CAP domain-containing protein [Puniceicoccaceae bacterium]